MIDFHAVKLSGSSGYLSYLTFSSEYLVDIISPYLMLLCLIFSNYRCCCFSCSFAIDRSDITGAILDCVERDVFSI